MTAVRLYYAEKGSKRWSRLKDAGALNLNQQAGTGILYFTLVDLDSKTTTWTHELYLDFKYHRESENFHSFEGDKGTFGILFADADEAEDFYAAVLGSVKGYTVDEKMPKKEKTRSKSIFGAFGFRRKSRSSENDSEASSNESTKSSSSKTKNSNKNKDSDLTHDDVSEPRDFTHLSHIGFNPEKGTFDIQNIPEDWKTLFAKAGITQSQLENKSTARFIAGFVQDSEPQMRSMKTKAKPPVPVPTAKKKTAAPPPPPMKKAPTSPLKSSAAAPPPPPPKKPMKQAPSTNVKAPSAPPAPPAPSAKALNVPSGAPAGHSALLDSIRGAGIGILKPVDHSISSEASTPKSVASNPHSALMESIKNGASLKPAPKQSPASPTSSVSSTDPTDMMAAMLAKALAARNKKLAASDSDEEDNDSDDSRW